MLPTKRQTEGGAGGGKEMGAKEHSEEELRPLAGSGIDRDVREKGKGNRKTKREKAKSWKRGVKF